MFATMKLLIAMLFIDARSSVRSLSPSLVRFGRLRDARRLCLHVGIIMHSGWMSCYFFTVAVLSSFNAVVEKRTSP